MAGIQTAALFYDTVLTEFESPVLHDLTNNGMTQDRDLKKYLFTGFFLFHNKEFRDIINESCE